jgi:serine protease Do
MKKIGLTLLTAFVGGAMALGVYKLAENKYADSMSIEDKQKVYFANNPSTAPLYHRPALLILHRQLRMLPLR